MPLRGDGLHEQPPRTVDSDAFGEDVREGERAGLFLAERSEVGGGRLSNAARLATAADSESGWGFEHSASGIGIPTGPFFTLSEESGVSDVASTR